MPSLQLTKIRQRFNRPFLSDVSTTLAQEFGRMEPVIPPGTDIALAVGSRGIANIAEIVKTSVDFVKKQGANPFIVPAMGSHGGATAAGQAEILRSYGVTEEVMCVPIRSSMETVELPWAGNVNRIFMDRHAYESEGVILINRIKPHTDYHGPYESGLVKLSVIGLGKQRQALEIHSFGIYGLRELIPPTARQILATGKILAGVAIVENAYDETMVLKVLPADKIMAEEPKLLAVARANMPKLPVDQVDVLIIDRMGKNISGAGLDTNIIGRIKIRGETEPDRPQIKSIVIGDLTEETHGNAAGLGLADVITQRLFDKIDLPSTYENIITSTFLERGKIPLIAENDATAYAYARQGCGSIPAGQERVLRIRDTLHLGEVYVSKAILDDLSDRSDIEVMGEPVDVFDDKGDLFAF
jgi:hypothetical protein